MTMTTTKKTLACTLVTVMMSWITLHTQLVLRQMTQNFLNRLMAIWKMLMRPHLKCMLRQVAVFKKHVSFWLVSRVPEAIFLLLVLVLLMAWLSHPLIENRVMSRGKGKKGKRIEKHRAHVSSLVPRSVRLRLVQLVVDHITLFVSVLISACCVDKWDTVLQNVPTKGNRLLSHLENVHLLGCAVFDSQCFSATVEEIGQDQDEEDIEDFVAFSIKGLEGSPFLTVEPRRQFLDS